MKKLVIAMVLLFIVFLNRWRILQLIINDVLWRSGLFRDIFDEMSKEYIIDDYDDNCD